MSNTLHDPYWKLRPTAPTPDEEMCHCSMPLGVTLCDLLTNNPISCVECRGEVLPERLAFDEQLSEEIATWLSSHRSLYCLWLSSGEYETWARDRLSDPHGEVNVEGRKIVRQLNHHARAYYWWFQDTDVEDYSPPDMCPNCNKLLCQIEDNDRLVCDTCMIIL